MERNCRPMKAFACSFILVFFLSGTIAYGQQTAPLFQGISPSLFGSVSQGQPSAGPIQLTMSDAIDRPVKDNLGSIIADQDTRLPTAAPLRALSTFLPKLDAYVSETVQQINL